MIIRRYAILFVLATTILSCSKESEKITPAPEIVGQWDARSVHLVLFDAVGDTLYQVKDSFANAYLVFNADKTYSSYSNNTVNWSGTYTWQANFLSTTNPIQGAQSFTITTLSATSMVLLSDRRVGKEGGITISKYTKR